MLLLFFLFISGCQFYPPGEYLRFIRVPENLKVGEEVLRVDVFPRNNLNLLPVDKVNIKLVNLEKFCYYNWNNMYQKRKLFKHSK